MPSSESIDALLAALEGSVAVEAVGLSAAALACAVARIYRHTGRPVAVVVADDETAAAMHGDLSFFLGTDAPLLSLPSYNLKPFKRLAYHGETAATRIRTLYRLTAEGTPPLAVVPVAGLLRRVIPKPALIHFADLVLPGEVLEIERLTARLVAGGYNRSVITEEPGDFSIRGGILDVFSPLYPEPVRIEMFGDVVEALRFFSPETQRKTADCPEAVILPAREAIIDEGNRAEVVTRLRARAAHQGLPVTTVRALSEQLRKTSLLPGAESLLALVYDTPGRLFDYFPADTLFVLADPPALGRAARDDWQQTVRAYMAARRDGKLCLPPAALQLRWKEARRHLAEARVLSCPAVDTRETGGGRTAESRLHFAVGDNTELKLALATPADRHRRLQPLVDRLRQGAALCTLLLCRTRVQADRLRSLLAPYDIETRMQEGFFRRPGLHRGIFTCLGQLSTGFDWPVEGLRIITEDEIFGPKQRRRPAPRPRTMADLLHLQDLRQGDLVVHQDHGIGRYEGLTRLSLEGHVNDYLLIVFRDDDRLYLPVDRMEVIQKYTGIEGMTPVLDKMGGRNWEKVKAKVRRSAERIAGELLDLYAARRVVEGHAFQAPDAEYRAFEAAFAYEETADQLGAIEEVLADMEAPTPMDRLVCGDVGYGKTEVALRASFVAVSSGRQVAVLVPTTVLAEQHYETFRQRFAAYPVQVACLSRFRPPRVQRQILGDLKDGRLDIVIGTHRLLQKDVVFKDLGLVVVDEEQRFGVRHKERLKQLRRNVDVLALTATPIPRTLHLSLMGVRDISVISTPPEQRQAIVTYVCEFDEAVIAEAIGKELARKGQIFFVHNNIQTIDRMAARLKAMVPEVRLDVAHGRMEAAALEKVMMRFVQREIDMLVCTTIIESGLDIPAANTMLINRADRYGLAQIYQLRGRVGRSDAQAYAYLIIPPDSLLSADAQKRLRVLMEHSDLGAGFQIAMNDLRIRGGGTILGAAQSGHIAAVGYDLFLDLMAEAMAQAKGEARVERLVPEINVPLTAFLPETYLPDIDQRMTAYRRLARVSELKEINAIKAELMDRYGPLPEPAKHLLVKIMLKVLAEQAGVSRLDLADSRLMLTFSPLHQTDPGALAAMVAADGSRFALSPDSVLRVHLQSNGELGRLVEAKNILQEIRQRVSC
ncbi:MAG: transcription-repair coupling factor [Desulfobacterales bacterium]|nr:transcription-repair coupling factor [Desulfobacterales bacterium]